MNRETRNAIERATQRARKLLEDDFASQLEGTFDVLRAGTVAPKPGPHLAPRQVFQRDKTVAAIEHKQAAGMSAAEAVVDYLRDAAFTTLNRFVALKMLEAREFVQECITRGEQSSGYREFCGMAPGVLLLPESAGYRLYIESVFDELSTEVKVLFDRRYPASVLWPKRVTFDALLDVLNATDLATAWSEDETIGWVYQFFNSGDERKRMREESQAPRNSRELAVRNQFFTPRYVVEFLVDNTLGRTWIDMHGDGSHLVDRCRYFVRSEEKRTPARPRMDPRDMRVLDPACGSGHFLLYCFDLLLTIYEEAWAAGPSSVQSHATGRTLRGDCPNLADLRRETPALILEHNLHGVDIDPRAAQIAAFALWLRAQRAWRDSGVPAEERPPVRRTNIVVAEPMPGDTALVEEFAERLDPPLLRDLFRKMVIEMRLAGELGTLIPVEDAIATELHLAREQFVKHRQTTGFLPSMEPVREQGDLDLSGIDDDRFFHEAEARIIDALRHFAEAADGGVSVRKRLFRGDAAQGIALIDLLRTRFDVVLMNPPFGAASLAAKKEFEKAYPRTKNDVYAAFVERGIALLHPHGLLGAITSRTGFFLSSFQKWRKDVILSSAPPLVVADLGFGVLDAMVETAAYVLGLGFAGSSTWFRLVNEADKTEFVKASRNVYRIPDSRQFSTVPLTPFVYWMPKAFFDVFSRIQPFEQPDRSVRCGMGTLDDFRFVRNWWEVSNVGQWTPYAKGGELSPFVTDMPAVVNFRDNGREVKAFVEMRVGSASRKIQAESFYFHPGLQYGRRIRNPSPAILPSGAIFSDNANGIFVDGDDRETLLAYLALLNGDTTKTILTSIAPVRKMEVGYLQKLPVPRVDAGDFDLISCALEASRFAMSNLLTVETSRYFVSPFISTNQKGTECDVSAIDLTRFGIHRDDVETLKRQSEILSRDDDTEVDAAFLDAQLEDGVGDAINEHDATSLSWAVGVAFGRFDIRLATGERSIPAAPDPFARLPLMSAGMVPLADQPFMTCGGILVDDKGTENDIAMRVAAVYDRIGNHLPDRDALRDELRREFFAGHVRRYSDTRRKAPIYWQLSTLSGGYSVWLYAHRLTRDSFFQLQNEVVGPKLAHEERQLTSLVQDAGNSPSASERKEIGAQESVVEELRAMLDEVKRVAPLWNPNLDDGVVLTMAPLWRLVPGHKSWQRELKGKWDELAAGKYDWAHLAMHLWPERVVPKCATDRSLAIAHGLEDVFWVHDLDGHWRPLGLPADEARHVENHWVHSVRVDLLTLGRDLWQSRYRDTGQDDRRWFEETEEGANDDHPLALRLWPRRVCERATDDESFALLVGLVPPIIPYENLQSATAKRESWLERMSMKFGVEEGDRAFLRSTFSSPSPARDWQVWWSRLDDGSLDDVPAARYVSPARIATLCQSSAALAQIHEVVRFFFLDCGNGLRVRLSPLDEIAREVSERASTAVKAALKGFLAAPLAASGTGRARGHRVAAAAAEGSRH